MRGLFWLLVVVAAAVALAIYGRSIEGYVLLVYPPYRVEMALLFFGVLALAAFAALYFVSRVVFQTMAIPGHVRAFRARRRSARAQSALIAALQLFFEGRYARVEKEAGRAIELGANSGVAALLAARAAHHLRAFARRDGWIERAALTGDSMHVARLVTRAELALDERDFVAARSALRDLQELGPKHIATLRMMLRAERGSGNWEEVLRLATLLAKRDAISPALAEDYKMQATIELLARDAGNRAALEARWKQVPAREQAHPRLAAAAARHAGAVGAATLAREIIEKALAAEWGAPLVTLYGELLPLDAGARATEARVRIERAEKWLRGRPEDPQLLATLGRLCMLAELWGKAQSYLEASLSFEETRGAHLELARLAEGHGRPADAQRHLRRGAELP